jgi:type IV pilus assembly protein PilV
LGLLAVAGMQVTAIRGNASANVISTKTAVAEGILEEILSWPIHDPFFKTSSTGNQWDFDPEETGTQPLQLTGAGSYTAVYSIDHDFNGITNLHRVEVIVSSGRTSIPTTLVGFKRTI